MKILPNAIINFHAVYNNEWLDSVFRLLKNSYNIIRLEGLDQYYYSDKAIKNACHITFDDGDASFYEIAYPLLKKHSICASIYVSPMAAKQRKNFWFQELRDYDKNVLRSIIKKKNIIETNIDHIPILNAVLKTLTVQQIWEIIKDYQELTKTSPKSCLNMNTEQLLQLHNSGLVNIGAHTLNHPILQNESDEISKFEIKTSIDELSDMLNHKVKYFAYPNGTPKVDFDVREMDFLKESGISLAFSDENKSFDKKDNPLSIPRIGLTIGNMNFIRVKLLLGRKWPWLRKTILGRDEEGRRKQIEIR